jgi:hypothetical protein
MDEEEDVGWRAGEGAGGVSALAMSAFFSSGFFSSSAAKSARMRAILSASLRGRGGAGGCGVGTLPPENSVKSEEEEEEEEGDWKSDHSSEWDGGSVLREGVGSVVEVEGVVVVVEGYEDRGAADDNGPAEECGGIIIPTGEDAYGAKAGRAGVGPGR